MCTSALCKASASLTGAAVFVDQIPKKKNGLNVASFVHLPQANESRIPKRNCSIDCVRLK